MLGCSAAGTWGWYIPARATRHTIDDLRAQLARARQIETEADEKRERLLDEWAAEHGGLTSSERIAHMEATSPKSQLISAMWELSIDARVAQSMLGRELRRRGYDGPELTE
jgi:hypothetical protein